MVSQWCPQESVYDVNYTKSHALLGVSHQRLTIFASAKFNKLDPGKTLTNHKNFRLSEFPGSYANTFSVIFF
jgi:hypothetical protein